MDEIQNLDKTTKNIIEQNTINKIKIKMKLPKETLQKHMFDSIYKNPDKIAKDAIPKIMSNDSLFRNEKIYEGICNINLTERVPEKFLAETHSKVPSSKNEEESNQYHNFGLSMYNMENLEKINDNTTKLNKYFEYYKINNKSIKKSKIKFSKLEQTYHKYKDDLLNLRKTMGDLKASECLLLINKIKKKEKEKDRDKGDNEREFYDKDNLNILRNNSHGLKNSRMRKQISLLNAIMNPKDKFSFSQFYLPREGSLLLSRIEEKKNKTKK
jgi:hypothetical protein